MGNSSAKESHGNLSRAPSFTPRSRGKTGNYASMNVPAVIASIHQLLGAHGILTWVVMPCYACMQAIVPFLEPTCEDFFQNISLAFLGLYAFQHVVSERHIWSTLLTLVAPPEVTILRQIGILDGRSFRMSLGVAESLNIYTDLTFASVARSCDASMTARWLVAWEKVPMIGNSIARIVDTLRFWGCCLSLCMINVIAVGIMRLICLRSNAALNTSDAAFTVSRDYPRVDGEVFFAMARAAEVAMMPSVGKLAEGIGAERVFRLDAKKSAAESSLARQRKFWGREKAGDEEKLYIQDMEDSDRISTAATCHFLLVLITKVLVGNAMQLWMQSSFFALGYDHLGQQAKIKIIVSMVLSAVLALIRCTLAVQHLGMIGIILSMLILVLVGWSVAKVYFAFQCESHLWNLTSGCISVGELDYSFT